MALDEREGLKIQLYNIIKKINNEEETLLNAEQSKKEMKVYYIWGPPIAENPNLFILYLKEQIN